MNGKKFFQLDSIKAGDKILIPIVLLDVSIIKNTFININYEVSALKIIENKNIYFKNINLNQKDFEYIVSSLET